MEATMKKKLDVEDEDAVDNRLEKQQRKKQTDFMKQLTDLAQQVVETTSPLPPLSQPEPVIEEIKQVDFLFWKFYSS